MTLLEWAFHPDIYPPIKDDRIPDDIEIDIPEGTFFHEYPEGAVIYHPVNGRLRIHPHILPSHRNKAKKIVMDSLGKVSGEVEAAVPNCFRHIIIFALQCGFKKSGVIKDDYLRDGVWYDSTLMVRYELH